MDTSSASTPIDKQCVPRAAPACDMGHLVAVATGLSLVVLMAAPRFASPYLIVLSSSILMYSVLAVSWTVFCGPTQYFSLGIAAFFGIGIYAAAILGSEWPDAPLAVLILMGGLASSLLAFLVGLTTLRIRGMYFAIFTFGLSELLRHFVMWWEVNKTGTVGRWIPPSTTQSYSGTWR